MEKNLRILPRVDFSSGFFYVEHAIVEKQDSSLLIRKADETIKVPAASILVLILGPGTSITHAAISVMSDCGTSVIWSGEGVTKFYAAGVARTRSSANLITQAFCWNDPDARQTVIRRLYQYRFREILPECLSLQQIRGREGARVREAYAAAARETKVLWQGRRYDPSDYRKSDPINRALSMASACLYGICHSAIEALGYSTAIGFIHVGKQLSFVYDVADLYKIEFSIPVAFHAVAEDRNVSASKIRKKLRYEFHERKLLPRISKDLPRLFKNLLSDSVFSIKKRCDDEETPNILWDQNGLVRGGVNYGGDDS